MRTRFLLTAALLSASVLTACERPAKPAASEAPATTKSAPATETADAGAPAADAELRREFDAIASQPIQLFAKKAPKATIAADGALRIGGETITVDAEQRAHLVAYRGCLVSMAQAGVEMESRFGDAVVEKIDATIDGFFDSGASKDTDAKRTSEKQRIQQAARRVCEALPGLFREQQALVAAIPQFERYANFEQTDIEACRGSEVFDQETGGKIGMTIATAIGNPLKGGMVAGFMAAKNEQTANAESGAEQSKPAAQ